MWRALWAGCTAAAALLGCGDDTASEAGDPAATPVRLVLRPGDCLLDLAPLATLDGLPSSNLPAPI